MKTFDEIAAEQGWNADSREAILKEFIASGGADLDDYALKRAFEENETGGLPDLQIDITGEYYGNAYPENREFRVRLTVDPSDAVVLHLEDSNGYPVVDAITISEEEADGIQKVATTSHSLDVYEDDWKIPVGIERTVCWTLGDAEVSVRLDESKIDEIATWLRFAVGDEEYTGGEVWEF
jgi:hypothetical protein